MGEHAFVKDSSEIAKGTFVMTQTPILLASTFAETLNSRNAGTNVRSAERIGSIRCSTPKTLRLTYITESVLAVALKT